MFHLGTHRASLHIPTTDNGGIFIYNRGQGQLNKGCGQWLLSWLEIEESWGGNRRLWKESRPGSLRRTEKGVREESKRTTVRSLLLGNRKHVRRLHCSFGLMKMRSIMQSWWTWGPSETPHCANNYPNSKSAREVGVLWSSDRLGEESALSHSVST